MSHTSAKRFSTRSFHPNAAIPHGRRGPGRDASAHVCQQENYSRRHAADSRQETTVLAHVHAHGGHRVRVHERARATARWRASLSHRHRVCRCARDCHLRCLSRGSWLALRGHAPRASCAPCLAPRLPLRQRSRGAKVEGTGGRGGRRTNRTQVRERGPRFPFPPLLSATRTAISP